MNFKNISPLEIVLFFIFGAYIILPFSTPSSFVPFIQSSVGLSCIVVGVAACMSYLTPVLGVLSIFVAYEMIRRCTAPILTPQRTRNQNLVKMNPPIPTSLEEEMVQKMAPIEPLAFIQTTFKPISDKVEGTLL